MRSISLLFFLLVSTALFAESFTDKAFIVKYPINDSAMLEMPLLKEASEARLTEIDFSSGQVCEMIVLFDNEERHARGVFLTISSAGKDKKIKQKFYEIERSVNSRSSVSYLVYKHYYPKRKVPGKGTFIISPGGATCEKLSNNDPGCEDFFTTLDKISDVRFLRGKQYLKKNGNLKDTFCEEIQGLLVDLKSYFNKDVFAEVDN